MMKKRGTHHTHRDRGDCSDCFSASSTYIYATLSIFIFYAPRKRLAPDYLLSGGVINRQKFPPPLFLQLLLLRIVSSDLPPNPNPHMHTHFSEDPFLL